jgi:hypothetical protein
MGDRLAAEYIIHTDTWTDTNMEYLLGIADRCADAAKSHDIEQNISASIRRSLFPVCSWRHRLV